MDTANLYAIFKERRSTRAFTATPLSSSVLEHIVSASSYAPSAFNARPWKFVAVTRGTDQFEKVVQSLSPQNAAWAQSAGGYIIACINPSLTDGRRNIFAEHDLGLATMCLLLSATARGLDTHVMGGYWARDDRKDHEHYDQVGFNPAHIRELVPKHYVAVTVIAVGYKSKLL